MNHPRLEKWSELFVTGIPQMDEEHKHLYMIISEMYEIKQTQVTREGFAQLLNRLADYTFSYLRNENVFMRDYGYPYYEAHHESHVSFMKLMATQNLQFFNTSEIDVDSVLLSLYEWWYNHVQKHDRKLANWIIANGLGSRYRKIHLPV